MESGKELTEKYYRLYRENISRIEAASSSLLNKSRSDAINRFVGLGIPSRKHEAYKYTTLETYFRHDYDSYFIPSETDFAKAEQFRCDVQDLDSMSIILLNGFFPAKSGSLHRLPENIWFGSLNEAASEFKALTETHLGKYARSDNDGLIHLNTAMAPDGIFIYIPRDTTIKNPVQIINLVDSDQDIFNQRRNLIIAEQNTSFTLIVCDHTLSPGRFLTNAVTEIFVGENAHFNIIRVQNEHNSSFKITNTFIHQERNSTVTSNNITLHGGLVRNNTFHYLAGEGAQCGSYGLYLSDNFQHVDNYVNVEHLVPSCTSNQLFKGVLDTMATGAFSGRIFVAKGAQGTSAYQKNNTILLTGDAKMNTRPHLEIFADDVKCSHGATIGQLDDDAMFYMQSRGIGKNEARHMLMEAFADEVIQKINIGPLRKRINELVVQRLRGELTRCASCIIKCG
ncbi:MAG: Fe-S cluster assembly protein SufD [Bacteroidales bacterium]